MESLEWNIIGKKRKAAVARSPAVYSNERYAYNADIHADRSRKENQGMSYRMKSLLWIAGFVVVALVIGAMLTSDERMPQLTTAANGTMPSPPQQRGSSIGVEVLSDAFTGVAEEMLPHVVSIATTRIVTSRRGEELPPFLRDFFGREFDFDVPSERRLHGLGSGIIISGDGYIVTNNHVISNAEDIKITLYDNRQFDAELVGADPLTEVAVVKIDGEDLPAARMGDSELLEIGEWVLAFGNPLYLTSTVTAGIISAKGRAIGIIRDQGAAGTGGSWAIENFIQTDAAINPGNSGGPLVNLRGEVVGINTAIASRTGGYQGYGFAIPINLARKIIDDLIDQGFVTRGWLGISMRPVDNAIAERFGMDRPRGAIINQVMEDSPAEKAGLQELDIILSIDGNTIERTNEVQSLVAVKEPGEEIDMEILRDGDRIEKTVELGSRKMETAAAEPEKEGAESLGMTVEKLDDRIRSRLEHDYYEDVDGLFVTGVDEYGAASEAGIRPGDLITEIEDEEVDSVSDYTAVVEEHSPGDVLIFSVMRGGSKLFAFVRIPGE